MKTQITKQHANVVAVQSLCSLFALLVVLSMTAATIRADTLSPTQLATTALISSLAGNGTFLGANFGPDNASPITFSASVDSLGQSFSYSTVSVYQGHELQIFGEGSFDPGSNIWHFGSVTSFNGLELTVEGTESVTPNDFGGFHIAMDQSLLTDMLPVNDFHEDGDISVGGGWVMLGGCYQTFKGIQVGPKYPCNSALRTRGTNDGSSWDATSPIDNFGVDIRGSLPIGGGDGTFVMSLATPEPSSLCLLGSGILGLAGVLRRRLMG